MRLLASAFALGGLACLVAGIAATRRLRTSSPIDRTALLFLPLVLAAGAIFIVACWGSSLRMLWNYCRLTPAVSLLYGYDLYDGPHGKAV